MSASPSSTVRYQTNEPTRDNNDASTAVIATVIAHLREDNEFLAGVNAEFGSENDDLKEEVNELKMKLEQYQIRSSSESLDVIDVPVERLAKRFKSDGSKKVKKTVHYAENQPKEEQEEQCEKEARYDDEVQHFNRMHPEDAPQWSYVEQEDFIYDTEIDSRSDFDEDEDYGEEMEEVLIDSQKSAASDDLAE
ncbi:unnamed protein product [Rhizophagus irregularis]|nr:unnamed protein product [Rhizophagus irregularis]